jgi:hypothetical protein
VILSTLSGPLNFLTSSMNYLTHDIDESKSLG